MPRKAEMHKLIDRLREDLVGARGEVRRLNGLLAEFTVQVSHVGGDTIVALNSGTRTRHAENLGRNATAEQIAKAVERVKAVAPVVAGDRACVVEVR